MINIITSVLFIVFICIGGIIMYDADTQIEKSLGMIVAILSLGLIMMISKLQQILEIMEGDDDDVVEQKQTES